MRPAYALAIALCSAAFVHAGTVCPAGTGANPFPHSPDVNATGCNAIITIAANGSITTVVTDSIAYENSEDALVGVVNNSPTPVTSITLTGPGIFGFEGDGICVYTFVGSSYCTTSQKNGTDPGDYQGPTSTFSNISGNGSTGTVNFSPAVAANGGTTYFSLEGVPTANIAGTVGGGGTPTVTPAPSSVILLSVGLLVFGLVYLARKRIAAV